MYNNGCFVDWGALFKGDYGDFTCMYSACVCAIPSLYICMYVFVHVYMYIIIVCIVLFSPTCTFNPPLTQAGRLVLWHSYSEMQVLLRLDFLQTAIVKKDDLIKMLWEKGDLRPKVHVGGWGAWVGRGGGEVEEQVNVGWEGKEPSTTCSLLSSFYLFTHPTFIYSLTSPPSNFMCKCAIFCVHVYTCTCI